ncbi:Phage integrase family protein [Rubrivivax sp. A210]|uniref:tyrosine-type recombinase/integrase n=1 Tax=Rubrivivax sp. A210 TaxID=2772301 RepID=UPI00191A9416|nr:integrase family protein [Rubrivivax sp. A210]CAD5366947.1 Phage integrase family protein [Rubrivivax sp. A210]
MPKGSRLTAMAIERAKPRVNDYYLSDDDGTRGGGRLVLRVQSTGSKLWYYRYSIDGARKVIAMRPFTAKPMEGRYTLEQARERARTFAALHRVEGSRDVASHLDAEESARQTAVREQALQAEQQRLEQAQVASHTVSALCDWYVKHLRKAGKVSANDANTIFNKNIKGTEWAEMPACKLTSKQAAALIRSVVESGRGRTAAKLRSYLRAAYALALKAELDATAPAELLRFGIEANPVANTAALSSFNRARERALAGAELGVLWRQLTAGPLNEAPLARSAIALMLLLGGQRPTQLLRARVTDVDLDAKTLTLLDPKGRRQQPRRHVLPINGLALDVVKDLVVRAERKKSDALFAKGKKAATVTTTVSAAAAEIVQLLLNNGDIKTGFQVRDLRRTAETMMAAMGVSKEVRAQIQSHGLGGVQDRHYDRHDYMTEKRAALAAFAAHLDALGGAAELTAAEREPGAKAEALP